MPRQLIVIVTFVGCLSLVAFFWSGRSRFRKPDDVIRLDSNDATAYHNQGITWFHKGELDKAITDFTEAIRIDPNNATAYFNRANVWANKGDLDKAITDFTEAIRLDPNLVPAYYNRGNAWAGKGDMDKAIRDYTEAIQLDPNFALAFMNRGIASARKGDPDKAIGDFTEAIRLDPNLAPAYFNRGNVLAEKGDPDMAIGDFTEAIRLTPNYIVAYKNLAWLIATCPRSEFRNGPKAVEYASKACEMTGWRDAGAVSTLAAAYAEVGDFQNAIKWAEKAIELATKESDQQEMRDRLELYKAGKPYRDMPKLTCPTTVRL